MRTRSLCRLGALLLVHACASEPAPAPAAAEPTSVPATPAAPIPPVTITPVPPVTPPPAPPEAPAPDSGPCDLNGTWQIKLVTDEDGCATLKDETFELALAYTSGATLASAAQPGDPAAPIGKLLANQRAAPIVAPGLECGLRLELRPASGPHAELLLSRDHFGFHGQGTYWASKAGQPCRQRFSAFAERTAPAPAAWSKLTAGPVPAPTTPLPASPELTAAARKISARALLGRVPVKKPAVKLTGSIVDYVTAVLDQPGAVELYEVPCSAAGAPASGCLAVVGDPCAPGEHVGEDCEGMFLTVVVDPRTGKLDRADSGRSPVESQADIEERLAMAP